MIAAGSDARKTRSLFRLTCGRLLRCLQRIDRSCAGKSTTLTRRLLRLLDHDVSALWAGHRAFNHQQVLVKIDADNAQIANGYIVYAHVAGHALSGEGARRE